MLVLLLLSFRVAQGEQQRFFQQNSHVAEALLEMEWWRESVISVLVDTCKL